jgi:hypothetical protein
MNVMERFRSGCSEYTAQVHNPLKRAEKREQIQWLLIKYPNPATPTTGFTKQFKRLVNFLNLRKNTKKALLSLISAGRFEYRALA